MLEAGYAPLVIPVKRRLEYITILSEYSVKYEAPDIGKPLYYKGKELRAFVKFCKGSYPETVDLIEGIK